MSALLRSMAGVRGAGCAALTRGTPVLRGLANVSYFAADVPAASRWYAELLGVEPYFVRPV